MAQAYVYSSQYFNTDGTVKPGAILSAPSGGSIGIPINGTVPTTSIDDVGDIIGLCAVKAGLKPFAVQFTSTSGASTLLDADLVMRTTDKNGVHTDLTLVDTSVQGAATFFVTAKVGYSFYLSAATAIPVVDDADGFGVFGIKIIAVAGTPVQWTFDGILWVR